MFGKAFMINFCSVLVVLSALGSSFAMPIVRRADSVKVARQLDTIVPGAQIPPVLVDLYDQYKNLQDQVIAATEGSPLRESLLKQLDAAKLVLEEKMKGIAVFAASTITVSSSTSTSASTSSTSVTSTTVSASSSTTTPPPSTSIKTDVPVVTIVTQDKSVVVVASQGVTSTVVLATITAVPSATSTSSSTSATSTSTRSVTSSSSSSNPNKSVSTMATVTITTTIIGPSSTAALAAENTPVPKVGGASHLRPSSMGYTLILGMIGASVFGALTVL